MNLGFNMTQGMQQNQVMSQKMIQAIEILEMNNEELNVFIQEQLLKNPILDWKEKSSCIEVYGYGEEQGDLLTAHEDLMIQLGVELKKEGLSKEEYEEKNRIGDKIIRNINQEGYLSKPLQVIAHSLCVSETKAEEVLKKVQLLEPIGVGSRTLQEYLCIQLLSKGYCDPKLLELVEKKLELVGKGAWEKLCEELQITKKQLNEFVQIIKGLSPRMDFIKEKKTIQWVTPEIKIVTEEERVKVEWIEGRVPLLFIPDTYLKLLKEYEESLEVQKYIKERIEQALWIIRCIEERRTKVMRVAEYLADYQKGFIEKGIRYKKPISQKQVAEALGMSNSTISRIVNNKYVETERGTLELKEFFSHGIDREKGVVSNEVIKEMIKEMIEREDKYNPISDEGIKQQLIGKGIHINRRTVAKYRISMNIQNSKVRKK